MSKYIYADNVYDKDPWKTWKNVDINGNDLDSSDSENGSSNSSNSSSKFSKTNRGIEITQSLSVLPRTSVTTTTADLNKVIIEKIH